MRKKPEHLDTDFVRPECRARRGVSKENGTYSARAEISLRARALQYLARREYSRAELRGKLLSYADGDPAQDLDALLDDLMERGWLSDERAATQLLHAKCNRFGAQRIVQELRRKGIAEELIGNALPALKENELEAARNVWRKKFGMLPRDEKEKARQVRFLQSRGFGFEVIFKVLRQSIPSED